MVADAVSINKSRPSSPRTAISTASSRADPVPRRWLVGATAIMVRSHVCFVPIRVWRKRCRDRPGWTYHDPDWAAGNAGNGGTEQLADGSGIDSVPKAGGHGDRYWRLDVSNLTAAQHNVVADVHGIKPCQVMGPAGRIGRSGRPRRCCSSRGTGREGEHQRGPLAWNVQRGPGHAAETLSPVRGPTAR